MTEQNGTTGAAEAAVFAVRNHRNKVDPSEPVTLSTGVRALVRGVPPAIIDDATSKIQDPPVPTTFDEEKGREIENPFDKAYLAAVDAAERERGLAAMDVMIMFGVDLVDGIPEDDTWLRKVRFMAKRGRIDFDETIYDLTDPMELEFVYKRYYAVGGADFNLISERSGIVNQEALRTAENTF